MTVESVAGQANRTNSPTRRDRTTSWCRRGGLAVVGVAAVFGLAACGGGHRSPQVASLPTSTSLGTNGSGGSTATSGGSGGEGTSTTVAKGDPTRLLDEWATCMDSHGDPNQADPTVDAYGVINVTIPSGAAQSLSSEVHSGADPCNQYMAAAQAALRAANPVSPPPDQSELIKYVNCMRANGVPNYPYPSGSSTNFNGTGVDPTSPQVQNVNKLCGQKLSLPGWWISGNGQPGDVVVSSGGSPPNGGGGGNRPRPAPANGGTGGNSGAGAGG